MAITVEPTCFIQKNSKGIPTITGYGVTVRNDGNILCTSRLYGSRGMSAARLYSQTLQRRLSDES